MKHVVQLNNWECSFTDDDVVNPEDYIPAGESNPHHVQAWLLHDHGFTLAVVIAESLQDALDIAADHGALDSFRLSEDQVRESHEDETDYACLGNDGACYDVEVVEVIGLLPPPMSIVALFNAQQKANRD